MSQYYSLAVLLLTASTSVQSALIPAFDDQTREIITNPGKCRDNSGGILDRLEISNCTNYEGCTINSTTTITLKYVPTQTINNPQYKLTFTPEGGQANPITKDITGPLPNTKLANITLGDFDKLNVNNCKTFMKLEILNDTKQVDMCVGGTIVWNANPKSTPCNNFATGLSASAMAVFASILMVFSKILH